MKKGFVPLLICGLKMSEYSFTIGKNLEGKKMRKGLALVLFLALVISLSPLSWAQNNGPQKGEEIQRNRFVPTSLVQGSAQQLYDQSLRAWQGVKDYTCVMESYNRLGNKEEYKTYEYWYLKPGYIRMKVIKGKGKGGEAYYDPKLNKVRGHKGGFFSFVKLTLKPDDKRVTSIRGVRIDQTTFGYILSQLKPYMEKGECKAIEDQGMKGLECSATDGAYHGDIWREKVLLDGESFMPVVWERYGKDGTLLYKLVCRDVKLNSGLTLKDVAHGMEFKEK